MKMWMNLSNELIFNIGLVGRFTSSPKANRTMRILKTPFSLPGRLYFKNHNPWLQNAVENKNYSQSLMHMKSLLQCKYINFSTVIVIVDNYLDQIYDSSSALSSQKIGSYCGSTNPGSFLSTDNVIPGIYNR